MIRIKEINTLDRFRELEEEWNQLLSECRDNYIFMRHEWAYNWANIFGIHSFRIFTFHSEDELVAIIPMKLDGNVLGFIGVPHCDYLSFIIRQGMEEPVILSFIDHIHDKYPDCILDLEELAENSILVRHYRIIKKDRRFICIKNHQNTTYPARLPASFLEMEENNMQKRLKRSIRRNLRRLEEDKLEISYYRTKDLEKVEHDMKDFFRLHMSRIKDCDMDTPAEDERYREFHKRIAKIFFDCGLLKLDFLMINKKPAACNYCFEYEKRVYCYLTGLDPNYYEYSVGNLSFRYSIQDAISNNDEIFDFLRGAHGYKSHWGCSDKKNYRIVIMRKNLRNRMHILKNFRDLVQPRRRIKSRFPKTYRSIKKLVRRDEKVRKKDEKKSK
jgi:CelD/BcsL family acetyltransferase involved in cellulose biosynthesis